MSEREREAWEAYKKTKAQAQEAYEKVEAPAWEAYKKATAQALKEAEGRGGSAQGTHDSGPMSA